MSFCISRQSPITIRTWQSSFNHVHFYFYFHDRAESLRFWSEIKYSVMAKVLRTLAEDRRWRWIFAAHLVRAAHTPCTSDVSTGIVLSSNSSGLRSAVITHDLIDRSLKGD